MYHIEWRHIGLQILFQHVYVDVYVCVHVFTNSDTTHDGTDLSMTTCFKLNFYTICTIKIGHRKKYRLSIECTMYVKEINMGFSKWHLSHKNVYSKTHHKSNEFPHDHCKLNLTTTSVHNQHYPQNEQTIVYNVHLKRQRWVNKCTRISTEQQTLFLWGAIIFRLIKNILHCSDRLKHIGLSMKLSAGKLAENGPT